MSNKGKFNVYEELAKDTSYSSKTIERYIKINYLIDEFKKLVDENKLTTEKYILLTKFSEIEQRHLYNFFLFNKLSFSKLNKNNLNELLEKGLSDESLENIFIKKDITTKSNSKSNLTKDDIEDLYKKFNIEKEKWIEIIDYLKVNKFI